MPIRAALCRTAHPSSRPPPGPRRQRQECRGRNVLKLCETHPGKIDLLVTDVVMPELGGRELAEAALKLRPGLKVVFVSGHTQDVILKEGVQQGAAFLHKPFTPMQLAQKVRDPLDFDAGTAH